MTSEVAAQNGAVIELGPGTGVFTQALLDRGIAESKLVLIESSTAFADALSRTVVRGALEATTFWSASATAVLLWPGVSRRPRPLFESRRKIEHAILDIVMARATTEQLDALEKLTDEEKHIHHHGDEESKTVLSGRFHIVLAKPAPIPS
jgi:hypothetical protein